jgi:hypothetical protein
MVVSVAAAKAQPMVHFRKIHQLLVQQILVVEEAEVVRVQLEVMEVQV